ncbi:MAG: hypothetical protein WC770_10155 [Phycisphaerae bacterium]
MTIQRKKIGVIRDNFKNGFPIRLRDASTRQVAGMTIAAVPAAAKQNSLRYRLGSDNTNLKSQI